jgi:threonine aldolase
VPAFGGVLCHRDAHIQNDECGAPEFFTHGAKLLLCDGPGAKVTPETVKATADAIANDVHRVQPRALSITNASEYGCVYTPDEVAALGALAKARGWGFHMDGARFANAVVHLGCTPAELTCDAGVDVLSFGFVKTGGLSAEAAGVLRHALVEDTKRRRKRAGHLLSKGRYLAAQIHAMLEGDCGWRRRARPMRRRRHWPRPRASGCCIRCRRTNCSCGMTPAEAAALRAQGFDFYDWAEGEIRLVTHWASDKAEVAALAGRSPPYERVMSFAAPLGERAKGRVADPLRDRHLPVGIDLAGDTRRSWARCRSAGRSAIASDSRRRRCSSWRWHHARAAAADGGAGHAGDHRRPQHLHA